MRLISIGGWIWFMKVTLYMRVISQTRAETATQVKTTTLPHPTLVRSSFSSFCITHGKPQSKYRGDLNKTRIYLPVLCLSLYCV